MKQLYFAIALVVLTATAAQAGDAPPINSAADIALRARLTAEADAKRAMKPPTSAPRPYVSEQEFFAGFAARLDSNGATRYDPWRGR